jgi:hypothetical protein
VVIDADIHVSEDLLFELKRCMYSKLLQSDAGYSRTVFVTAGGGSNDDCYSLTSHAAFEKQRHLPDPRNKAELLAMLEKGDARV